MKKSLALLAFASFLLGCNLETVDKAAKGDNTTTTEASSNPSPAGSPSRSPADVEAQKILGSFVGAFGDNKITLMITSVKDDTVAGRTIVGGNDRPFDGTVAFENASYSVVGREPGDHKDDGVFNFTISADNFDQLKGTWKANDAKRPVKSYTLERRSFQYKANVGSWPEASTRLLKAEDVENLPKDELEFMRNEIFARHGYCFSKKHLRQQFENEDWYVPNTTDIKGFLTDTEKKNIALIKRYEKYAEEYSDEYGR
ncbi:MAG: YARHG domain-containing protein [Pyrinomonadaceae bacterium]